MFLTPEEKQRFCEYLQQYVEDEGMIIEQMKKMPIKIEVAIKHKEIIRAAYVLVLKDLKSWEEF